MKIKITGLLFFAFTVVANGQPLPDSVLIKYKAAGTENEKGKYLFEYLQLNHTSDSSVKKTFDLSYWFKEHHDEVGADYTDLFIAAIIFYKKNDNGASLKTCFDVLPHFEKRKDNFGIARTYSAISNAYFAAREYEQA